jgi:hypothetical protein
MASGSSGVASTDKTLNQITVGLNLALIQAEAFADVVKSGSGNVEELRRIASELAKAINFVDDKSRALDANDPRLIIPRDIVDALVKQASSGDAYISRRLEECKAEATEAIQIGVAQAAPLRQMSKKLRELLENS